MNIFFNPCNMSETLTASVSGDAITLNGKTFDFSRLSEGDLLPGTAVDSEWIAHNNIYRLNGVITLTLTSPYNGPGNQAQRFPEPLAGVEGEVPFPQPDVVELPDPPEESE
jgi:hypothetical protein